MIRKDLHHIASLIPKHTKVLDLGCGQGELLSLLKKKSIQAFGVECDPEAIRHCIKNHLNVIEADISHGVGRFCTNVDVSVMSLTLQQMHRPEETLAEMLKLSNTCIVSLHNFGYWRIRIYLLLSGKMPVTKHLSYQWYDTPNVRFCTLKDFENMLSSQNITISKKRLISPNIFMRMLGLIWPNLFSQIGIYLLHK